VDINLFPEQFRKKPSVIGRYATLALVVLALITGMAWAGSHFVHQRVVDRRVDAKLNELSDEIKALGQAQSEIAVLQERIDYLDNLQKNRIHALEFLKELTEVLPDTAWLSGLAEADGKVEIQGYADYSTRLITRLEDSPLFANAKFISTITQGRDGKQVFKIGFEIKGQ
jgi:general secretion pathway protein L